jgi:hypothetical protein
MYEMKQSKYSWEQWLEAVPLRKTAREHIDFPNDTVERSRKVHNVRIGDVVKFRFENSYFGSGGYSGSAFWQSPDGECPVETVEESWDNGFVSGSQVVSRFVRAGVIFVYEYDCIGSEGRTFADDIYFCE